MCYTRFALAALCASGILVASSVAAQLGGSRAGVEPRTSDRHPSSTTPLPLLDRKTAEGYIAIDGSAEIRLPTTAIRIVLAITRDGETAEACRQRIDETISTLTQAWSQIGVADEQIVVDFIAILPQYAWQLERQEGIEVGVERKVGYRMQTNVHLEVAGASQAQQVLDVAMQHDITDIIAFDYWHRDLDDAKARARQAAVDAARAKADTLLGAIFDNQPQPINVQEKTTVIYPESLYQTFTNVAAETVTPSFRRDIPFIRAARPQNTYYRGFYGDTDVQPGRLPMEPEISVMSTVRIYYQSPASRAATLSAPEETPVTPKRP